MDTPNAIVKQFPVNPSEQPRLSPGMAITHFKEFDGACELAIKVDPGLTPFIRKYGVANARFATMKSSPDVLWSAVDGIYDINFDQFAISANNMMLSTVLSDFNHANELYQLYNMAKSSTSESTGCVKNVTPEVTPVDEQPRKLPRLMNNPGVQPRL